MLKIVNKRRYPLLVGYPNFKSTYVPRANWGWERLSRRLTAKDKLTLMPRDEAVFETNIKDGGSAAVGAEYNGQAQSLYQLQFGIETALSFLDRFGVGPSGKTGLEMTAKYASKFMNVGSCAEQLLKLDKVNVGTLLIACFDPDIIMEVFGWKGLLIAPAMVAGPVVDFFRSEFNAMGDILNGRDRYALTVNYKNPMDEFEGKWNVHGAKMVINKDATGTYTWNDGPCPKPGNEFNMCDGHATLAFKVTGKNAMVGTYTRVWYTSEDGGYVPDNSYRDSGRLAGKTFMVKRYDDHTLITYDGTGSRPGNPYLCDEQSVYDPEHPERWLCGA